MKSIALLLTLLSLTGAPLTAQKLAVYALGAGQHISYDFSPVDAGGITMNPGSGYGGRLGLSVGIPVNLFGREPGEVIIGIGIDQQRGLAIAGTKETVVDSAGIPDRIVSVTHVLQGRNAQVLEVGIRGAMFKDGRLKFQTSLVFFRWGREMSTAAYRSLDLDGVPLGEDFREPLQVLFPDQLADNSNPLFSTDKRPDNPNFSLALGATLSYELGKGIDVFLGNEISITNSLDDDFYEVPRRRLNFDNFQIGFRGRLF
jgi:hypothetical protein